MNWAANPVFYQIRHPWHWLTYGQNGMTLGLVFTATVNAFTVIVLYQTLRLVNRQAIAAETQAEAAHTAAALSKLQLARAEERVSARKRARFADASILSALADSGLWGGSRPVTGSGDQAVRADELAELLSVEVDFVVHRLQQLKARERVRSVGGSLADSTARWIIVR